MQQRPAIEQLGIVGIVKFRMPLHADNVVRSPPPDRLDHLIRHGNRLGHKFLPQPFNSLMMNAVDARAADAGVQPRQRRTGDE